MESVNCFAEIVSNVFLAFVMYVVCCLVWYFWSRLPCVV